MILDGDREVPVPTGGEEVDHLRMVIDMDVSRIRSIAQVRQFLEGTPAIVFKPRADDAQRYALVSAVVQRLAYGRLARPERGLVLRFLRIVSGYGSAQVKRLVAQVLAGQRLRKHYSPPAHAFARRFTSADITLLATVDHEFDTLSGPATVHIFQRAWHQYGDTRFERLATISVSHLYNLRHSKPYQHLRVVHRKTRSSAVKIGVRKAPRPDGRPGFIRIDSVHQGDLDGLKGVYHINAVDCVTQWQVVLSCERISEAFLLPVLELMLASFPFPIRSIHADNGSEYINFQVATLLDKLHVELTKSRPRHSNDNALAETKNGAVVRKVFGYEHIPQHFASIINVFNAEHLTPFLNLHRPCLFATTVADPKKAGRIRKVYRHQDVMTPLEKLASLPPNLRRLKPGVTLEALQAQANTRTDLQVAHDLNVARQALFAAFRKRA